MGLTLRDQPPVRDNMILVLPNELRPGHLRALRHFYLSSLSLILQRPTFSRPSILSGKQVVNVVNHGETQTNTQSLVPNDKPHIQVFIGAGFLSLHEGY